MGMVVCTVSLNGEERLNFGKETRYKHVNVIRATAHAADPSNSEEAVKG